MSYSRTLHIIAFVLTSITLSAAEEQWKLGAEKDGIKVWTRKTDECKMRTSRAEMFVPIPVDKVLSVLNDFPTYAGWFPSCKDAKVLKRINTFEFMAILTYKTPWPLPNLDCVERMVISSAPKGDTTFINVFAEPNYIPQVKDVARVKQMRASWKLVSVKGGTYLINEYFSDMGNLVPAWIGNTQAVEIPFNIFSGIKKRLADLFGKK